MAVRLTQDADEDLELLIDFSIKKFGLNQTEKYKQGLFARFESILDGVAYSTDYSFVREGLKRVNYESHAIYYEWIGEDEILIMRILHQRMKELRHLE